MQNLSLEVEKLPPADEPAIRGLTWVKRRRNITAVRIAPEPESRCAILIGHVQCRLAGWGAAQWLDQYQDQVLPDEVRDGKHHFWFLASEVEVPGGVYYPHLYQPNGDPASSFWLGWSWRFDKEERTHIDVGITSLS